MHRDEGKNRGSWKVELPNQRTVARAPVVRPVRGGGADET
jgi:hypothetical protein